MNGRLLLFHSKVEKCAEPCEKWQCLGTWTGCNRESPDNAMSNWTSTQLSVDDTCLVVKAVY